jgi:hypothetical protein
MKPPYYTLNTLLKRYKIWQAKIDAIEKEVDAIIETSAVGQPPPILGRLLDKSIKISDNHLKPLWIKLRTRIIPGSPIHSFWQEIPIPADASAPEYKTIEDVIQKYKSNKAEYEKINWVEIARDRWNNYIKQQLMAGQRMEGNMKEYSEQVKQSFINAGYRIEGYFAIKGTEPETILTDKQKESAIYKQLMREFMSSRESGLIYTSIRSFKTDIQDGTIKPYQIWHLPSYPRYAMMLQEKEWAKEEKRKK